jgi:phage minor structural protein
MIPILFSPKAREYNNNGLGVLVDVGYCTVTEERNGAFELELQYPVNGRHYSDLAVDCQILAKPNETSNPQAFRIYNISKPMNGVVTVSAEHISYELSSIIVNPFSASSIGEAFNKIKSNSIGENPFEFWTDKSTVANMSQSIPLSARSLLGGVAGSVLDTYTGEYEFDNYTVKLHQNRGADNGVVISYAKNLTGVKCEERLDGVVTGVLGYWSSQDESGGEEKVVGDLQTVSTSLSYSRNVVVDFSSEYETKPTKKQINDLSQKYINSHKNVPYFSVSVEFVNLGDTEEYKQYKDLYQVSLCDTVTVRHPIYGINVKAKVVKTVFDSVREKYEKIEIGEASANISQTIVAQEKEIAKKVGFSDLDKAVASATSLIAGNKGGYVVLYPNAINPQELLVLDKPNIEEAENVWRWNLAGLGHSGNGYNGEYSLAIMANGSINADFIKTGSLSANMIYSGTLSSSNGLSSFSLDSGSLQIGGEEYYTKISFGSIEQHLSILGGLVGGLVPTGNVESGYVRETIYYNAGYSLSKGVSITAKRDESYFDIATFDKNDVMFFSETQGGSRIQTAVFSKDITTFFAEDLINGYAVTAQFELGKAHINGDLGVNGTITGTNVSAKSDRSIKKNIKKTKTQDALSKIKSLSVYDYDLKDNGKSVKMGLMADEAPAEILSDDGKGINLYSYCGMIALAVRELSEKVDQIDKNGGNYGRKD